jgi:hypothetical protein
MEKGGFHRREITAAFVGFQNGIREGFAPVVPKGIGDV